MRIEDDILKAAVRYPDKIAIQDTQRSITYAQLDQASRALADQLSEKGIQSGSPVWLSLPNSIEYVIGFLAILRSGGVVVPVNDKLSVSELSYIAQICAPAAILTTPAGIDAIRGGLHSVHQPAWTIGRNGQESYHFVPELNEISSPRVSPLESSQGEPGLVLFTSGSTGRPKAVLLTHENITFSAQATTAAFGITSNDRTLVCLPLCHSFALTKQLLTHLGTGATIILAPNFFQPSLVLTLLREYRCTTLYAVPSNYVMLLDRLSKDSIEPPHLRLMVFCGAPMHESTQRGLLEALPQCELISYYGLSEASPVAWASIRREDVRLGLVGRSFPQVEIQLLDDNGQPMTNGEPGEVCVSGPIVMSHYLADTFATERVKDGDYLRTGDIGQFDKNGILQLCGRKDDRILRGAENIDPLEIENVLCGHPSIKEAVVIGVPDRILGQELAAYVVLKTDNAFDKEQLKRFCRERLAGFKIPRWIYPITTLPKTPNGKILRRALLNR